MEKPFKTYLNWSSGKDAALALHYLQKSSDFHVQHLLTSVNAPHNRVSMHGVRRALLQQQTEAIGLPYSTIELPEQPDMPAYEAAMQGAVLSLKDDGFTHTAFGDIFLEDLRQYRERQLQQLGIDAIFPLWKKDTRQMLQEMISLGFKAIVVAIDASLLPSSFAGRIIDKQFIQDLPPGVDACGENGEFHTFCYDGPIFKKRVQFEIGEKVYREYKAPANSNEQGAKNTMGFWFCDLLPVG